MADSTSISGDEFNAAFVQALIDNEVPEGQFIEFKEKPPAKGATQLDWTDGDGKLKDRSRNKVLEESTAFANAYGGTLVLGIKESTTKPPKAVGITPIPDCAELGARLRLAFRDCVEPELPQLEIRPIPVDGQNGVVVVRVGRSLRAPHRVIPTRACPVRRADRCEQMTMLEIQDLTLNVARGMERLEGRLERRLDAFREELKKLVAPDDCYGIRLTAVPVDEGVLFDRLFEGQTLVSGLAPEWCSVAKVSKRGSTPLDLPSGFGATLWRPVLRGARADAFQPYSDTLVSIGYREIHCDGLVEIGFGACGEHPLPPDYPIVMMANLVEWVRQAVKHAKVPMAEYAVDVEVRAVGESPRTGHWWAYQRAKSLSTALGGLSQMDEYVPRLRNVRFPRYAVSEQTDTGELLGVFEQDYWHSWGKHFNGDDEHFEVGTRT